MISHNLEYWDDEVLQLYAALYEAFLDMLEHDNRNKDYAHAPEKFYEAFRDISLSSLKHTQAIARELYMPPLRTALYENYHRSAQRHEEWIEAHEKLLVDRHSLSSSRSCY